jgi:hypothetical protein
MPARRQSRAARRSAIPEMAMLIRCGRKCGQEYGQRVRTWTAARPRQHWVFADPPSPTTRPPRMSSVGRVRVVGLGVFSVRVLAGAGVIGAVVQTRSMTGWDGDERRDRVWLGCVERRWV